MRYEKQKLIELINSDKRNYAQIANKTSLHVNTVGKIARGDSLPSVESLPLFAELYRKDINYFYDITPTLNSKELMDEPLVQCNISTDKLDMLMTMLEQQKEISEQAKEIGDLRVELERIKNANAAGATAQVG